MSEAQPALDKAAARPVSGRPVSGRLGSLDAYRGLVMFLMLAEVLALSAVAGGLPSSGFWEVLAHHQTHVEWVGCSLHDLIQPSFSFLVGVSLPFSIAARRAKGQGTGWMTLHALWRAVVLVLLGVFLRSTGSEMTNWTFVDTLSQIGLGYFFLFLLGLRTWRLQVVGLALILVGYWTWFALYPLPGADFDWQAAGVPADWPHHLSGFAAHWNKNTNPAAAFDAWFLNRLPQQTPFINNSGGYATLSFIPTLGTMILGLLAGGILHGQQSSWRKTGILVLIGGLLLASGWGLGLAGICPVVKRIWTPSWVLYSGGFCFLFLAGFYAVLDVARFRWWAFPLVVIGANSIAAYLLAWLCRSFIRAALVRHLGSDAFLALGPAYETLLLGGSVLLIQWLVLLWLYRNKVFIRI